MIITTMIAFGGLAAVVALIGAGIVRPVRGEDADK
jgi:hypothetical protein